MEMTIWPQLTSRNQGKEILVYFPFAANGNDYLATTDEQKLSVYKWMNVKNLLTNAA